ISSLPVIVLASTSGASRKNSVSEATARMTTLLELITWVALVTLFHVTGETRLEAVWTIMPSPLDDQDRVATPFVASMFSAGACGGIVRLTETGAERVVAPELSAASAVRT